MDQPTPKVHIALPDLAGRIGDYQIYSRVEGPTANNLYKVLRCAATGVDATKLYVLKSYADSAGYGRELRVFSEVYAHDETLRSFFLESAELSHEQFGEIRYSILQLQDSDNLFRFAKRFISKKKEELCLPEPCCRFFLHRILTCLREVEQRVQISHCRLNLQNVLVSQSKGPIVTGWSSSTEQPPLADVLFACLDLYCVILMGCPITKQKRSLNKSQYFSPLEWRDFERYFLELKKPKIQQQAGNEAYLNILSLFRLVITEKEPHEDPLTYDFILAHPLFEVLPPQAEVEQTLTKLDLEFAGKEADSISKNFQKKKSREEELKKANEEVVTSKRTAESESLARFYKDSENSFMELEFDLRVEEEKSRGRGEEECLEHHSIEEMGKKKSSLEGQVNQLCLCHSSLQLKVEAWKQERRCIGLYGLSEWHSSIKSLSRGAAVLEFLLLLINEPDPDAQKVRVHVQLTSPMSSGFSILGYSVRVVESALSNFYNEYIASLFEDELFVFKQAPLLTLP